MCICIDYVSMGARIKALRLERKQSQESIAEGSGLSVSFWGHIERGTRKCSVETLVRIASVFDVSLDYLVYGYQKYDEMAIQRNYALGKAQELHRAIDIILSVANL